MAEDRDFDVIVVGAGAAGLMAAVEAADAGASVCIVESEAEVGGSTQLSGAYVTLCETELQPGSREELLEDLLHSHQDDCQEDLSRLYVDEAPGTWRRLDELGVKFVRTFQFAHMSKPWAHELSGESMGGGAEIVACLKSALRKRGVTLLTSARVVRLMRREQRVTGVEVEKKGHRSKLHARRGVVITTGGFTRSVDLIRNFGRPGSEMILPMTGEGSRGDGLLLGMSMGAGIAYMMAGIAPTAPIDEATGKGVMAVYAGAIAVNLAGHRFTRESDLYIDLCWSALRQPKATFAQIYDAPMRTAYADTMMGKVLTGYREIEAGSVPELADILSRDFGFAADALVEAVAEYNNDVASSGIDNQFGRTNLVGTSGTLRQLGTAPFYAAVCRPGTTHFNGGLSIDNAMRVRDVFGEPIEGLYAAGEVTGGFHGAGYMSGTFVGMALIFGRLAGSNAASMPHGVSGDG